MSALHLTTKLHRMIEHENCHGTSAPWPCTCVQAPKTRKAESVPLHNCAHCPTDHDAENLGSADNQGEHSATCIATGKTSHEHATVVDDEWGHNLIGQEAGMNGQKEGGRVNNHQELHCGTVWHCAYCLCGRTGMSTTVEKTATAVPPRNKHCLDHPRHQSWQTTGASTTDARTALWSLRVFCPVWHCACLSLLTSQHEHRTSTTVDELRQVIDHMAPVVPYIGHATTSPEFNEATVGARLSSPRLHQRTAGPATFTCKNV